MNLGLLGEIPRRIRYGGILREGVSLSTAHDPEPERPICNDALSVWDAAEYERCLQLCSPDHAADARQRAELAVIRARVLLRLGRHEEVQPALSVVLDQPDNDLRLTARGLIGAARVRSGDATALVSLQAALAEAQTAARGVRSEIALHVALAQFAAREYAAADAALDLVSLDADIVYARAPEYRGWLAMACGEYGRSTTAFADALDEIERCRRRDLYAEVNCMQALAGLALERFDRAAWSTVKRRRAKVDWSAPSLQEGSWIAALAEGLRRVHAAGNLSHVQRQYLALLCDGKSNPEIARICKRSVHTVRNQVAALFETFGVEPRRAGRAVRSARDPRFPRRLVRSALCGRRAVWDDEHCFPGGGDTAAATGPGRGGALWASPLPHHGRVLLGPGRTALDERWSRIALPSRTR